jgi:CelD/BcsL family acetyltransferase involved in cellulose biosynthesis
VKIVCVSASQLSPSRIERWAQLQALTPEFASPLLGPYFAQLVDRYRGQVRVAVGSLDDREVAFFAFHPLGHGVARPVGAPFCDYQGIVSDPNITLDGEDFLRQVGILRMAVSGLIDPKGGFACAANPAFEPVDGFRIQLKEGGLAYLEQLRQANPKWAKNLRRLTNKLEREIGTLRLIVHDRNRASFEAVMRLKAAQYAKTGLTNVLRPEWVIDMMAALFGDENKTFGGCLISLYAGETFISGQFGVRQGDWFHPWIAATNPQFLAYSPGIVFLSEMIRHAQGAGISTIDLSHGHGHYKSQFVRQPITVYGGEVGASVTRRGVQQQSPLQMVQRRLDLIAAVEPTLAGRVQAGIDAFVSAPRRFAARHYAPSE